APASFRWDNVVGREPRPRRGGPLPSWATEQSARPGAQASHAAVKKQQERLALAGAPQKVIAEELKTTDPAARELAVYSAAAVDDLPAVLEALSNTRFADERQAAIHALRHWIGEATMLGPKQVAGQDMRLYQFLTKQQQFSDREAESVLQLLHG